MTTTSDHTNDSAEDAQDDGVRLAPTDAVDGRKSSYQLGTVGRLGGAFMSKSQKRGFSETISVTVDQ